MDKVREWEGGRAGEGTRRLRSPCRPRHSTPPRRLQADAASSLLDALVDAHARVSSRAAALRGAAGDAVAARDAARARARALAARLAPFDAADRAAADLHALTAAAASTPPTPADDAKLMDVLAAVDGALEAVLARPAYADAPAAAARLRALAARGAGAARARVAALLKAAVAAAAGEAGPAAAGGAAVAALPARGGADALADVRFRAAAEPALRPLLAGVAARAGRPEFAALLADCRGLYGDARAAAAGARVAARVRAAPAAAGPAALAAAGAAALADVASAEAALYAAVFGGAAGAAGGGGPATELGALLRPLGAHLHDALRPLVVRLDSIDDLVDVVAALREAAASGGGGGSAAAAAGRAAARPALECAAADAQERLAFRAQAFIKDAIGSYVPSKEDVDYPGVLERAAASASADGAAPTTASPSRWASDAALPLYPPVSRAAALLDAVAGAVGASVCAGLAADAAVEAARAVRAGAAAVAAAATPADGHLFAARALLALRSRLHAAGSGGGGGNGPADIDVSFDLAPATAAARAALAGRASFGSIASAAAASVAPRARATRADGGAELDAALRGACDAFILNATRTAVEPLLSFITKVTAVRAGGGGGRRLGEHAFAAPARVADAAAETRRRLTADMPRLASKAALYVPDAGARAALWGPVQGNVREACAQVAALLSAEYAPADVERVAVPGGAELDGLLAALV